MSFDQLSDAGKIWFVVYSHIASRDGWASWRTLVRAVRQCGVPQDQIIPGNNEMDAFLFHCHSLASQIRSQHRKNTQKARK